MLYNENLESNISVTSHRIRTDFKILKTINCKSLEAVELIVHNLEHLKKAKFPTVKVPQFSYEVSDLVITQTCEFIKGCTLACHPCKEKVIMKEIVQREDDYTFSDYHHSNYIIKDNDLYAVDLSSYGYLPDQFYRNHLWINRPKSCL